MNHLAASSSTSVSKNKKKENRSRSQHYYPSPRKNKKFQEPYNSASSITLPPNKTIIIKPKQPLPFNYLNSNIKNEYDRSVFVYYLFSHYDKNFNLERNKKIYETIELPSSHVNTRNKQINKTNSSKTKNHLQKKIYIKHTSKNTITINKNELNEKTMNKLNYISELKKLNYIQGIFIRKKRKLHLYNQFLNKKIQAEIVSLISLYINKWFNAYLSKIGQKETIVVFDQSLSPIIDKNCRAPSRENSGMLYNFLFTTYESPGYPTINNNSKIESNNNNTNFNTIIVNNTSKIKSKDSHMHIPKKKSELTPFPKKKEKSKQDDILYSKASGAANLIRRIEYSNYIKSSKSKYSKEIQNKNAIKIQRWWRKMLQNNTFYFKIMQIQKIWKGYLLRNAYSSAKVYYFKIIPSLKIILFIWYKKKIDSLFNYLLAKYALLYMYKQLEEGVRFIKSHFDSFIKRNKILKEQMKDNKIIFKRYPYIINYCGNLSQYKKLLKKITLIQKEYKKYYVDVLLKKNALIKGIYFVNDKIQKRFIEYQLSNLVKSVKHNLMFYVINQIQLYSKTKVNEINNNKLKILNKIFTRHRIKSGFQMLFYQIKLLKYKTNAMNNFIHKIMSILYFRNFIKNLLLYIKNSSKRKLLIQYITTKEIKIKSQWFNNYIKNTLYRNIKQNDIFNKYHLYLVKWVTKKDLKDKMYWFKQWERKLLKYNLSKYHSALLIIRNIFIKRLSIYFNLALSLFANGKYKKLKRVTRIFTNENSKIYFVSEKSAIHSKLRKIVRNCIKMNQIYLHLYFLKYIKNCDNLSFSKVSTPSSMYMAPKIRNVTFSTISRVKRHGDDFEDNNMNKILRKNIIKSILNLKKRTEMMILSKYFIKYNMKCIGNNLNYVFVEDLLTSIVQKKINKENHIKSLFFKKWKVRTVDNLSNNEKNSIQHKCLRILGPYKIFIIIVENVIFKHFFMKIKQHK